MNHDNNNKNHNSPSDLHQKHNRIASWLFLTTIFAIPIAIYAITTLNQPTPTIKWYNDPQNALTDAKSNNKLVLINFTAQWCPPCQTMKQDVLPAKTVEQAIKQQYIPLHLDIDENPLATKWTQNYSVEAIPTFIIINSNGQEIDRLQGSAPVSTFVHWLEQFNAQAIAQKTHN